MDYLLQKLSVVARNNLHVWWLVNAIVEQHEVKVNDEKVKQMIDDMASSYEEPEQVVNYYYGNEEQLGQIQNLVLEDQVIDTILSSAVINDVDQSYDDAIKPPEPPIVDDAPGEVEAAAEDESSSEDK